LADRCWRRRRPAGWLSCSGRFLGTVKDSHGQPIGEDGLWGMAFGNGAFGTPNDLVVAIGADEYRHGLVELVHPAPEAD
jgi:hypothetical protein